MEIVNSFDLLKFLKEKDLLLPLDWDCVEFDEWNPKYWWWPNALSFEVVVGALLVQNTRFEQVECALAILREKGILHVESLAQMPLESLQDSIKNVGFFRQKAKRLQKLCQNILQDFKDYATFSVQVDKKWLLSQKGIGLESCDAILNYALGREVMVADHYTYRILRSFGFALESYKDLQEWLSGGIVENYDKVCALYGFKIPLNLLFARLHGKIVEYAKITRIKG